MSGGRFAALNVYKTTDDASAAVGTAPAPKAEAAPEVEAAAPHAPATAAPAQNAQANNGLSEADALFVDHINAMTALSNDHKPGEPARFDRNNNPFSGPEASKPAPVNQVAHKPQQHMQLGA